MDIFTLAIWIDTLIFLGVSFVKDKVKGVYLSFVVGIISAGPIYATFPMCVMLRKKGASIRNIIIILSSGAVSQQHDAASLAFSERNYKLLVIR